jgi:LacI family repressor for deo operon, udp, cdd, tsx, nupC, and nupG
VTTPSTGPGPELSSSRGRATIEDVAAAAGVSVATVSRALRGLPNVASATRERVASIAEQMSYRADPAASRLATGRSRSIAVAVPLLNGWYFSQVVAGAEAICATTGYDMIVVGVSTGAARRSIVDEAASIHRRVDGVIFVDIHLPVDDVDGLADKGLRVVTIGESTHRFPSVGIDDVAVGDLATTHLLALGHRRIGLIDDQPTDPHGFVVPSLRRTGHHRALARAGIEPDPRLQAPGSFSLLGGRAATHVLLALPDPPTAVFSMSDEMAFGAMLALRDVGRSTPADLSIVGVDDHDLSIVVGLTTVRQSVSDHGSRAARLLIDQLEGLDVPIARCDGDIELIERETCSKP